MTTIALDKHAFQGAPQGFKRSSFPNGEPILHPSKWNREHWSYNQALRTRVKSKPHEPMTAADSLKLIAQMMKGLKK